ncbi:PspC domain-containing protein [Microlunatus antarcticus]|uniref:Phage shock protein PspC (Stress-responsive transcriptional regulator) n=1 Tax=Microlunatus antarcticus TaxID=53388 RepID=A0A7W5P5P5_9ACTN|nr:PspC domain-containing protein [Microlunatus antarcticus]MBB3325613.1 phage shock protein PspC (stress-responsive transcriptional regulator) [Microlunatus antarcticus]
MPTFSTVQRSAGDTKLAGVCGGVAERWGLDPVLVRVGFVLLALTGGVGVVLYLAAWLLLPVAGTQRAAVDDLLGGAAARWPRELWIALVVVACIISFGIFGAVSPFGVAPALALAALWWFGYHRPRARRARDAGRGQPGAYGPGSPAALAPAAPSVPWSGPVTPFTQAAAAWQTRVREVQSGVWSPGPAAPEPLPTLRLAQDTALRHAQDTALGQAPETGWTPVPTAPQAYAGADPVRPPDADELARAAFLAEADPVGLYTEPEPVPLPAVRRGTSLAARRLRLGTVLALGLAWLGLGVADQLGATVDLAVYAGVGLAVVALGLLAATRWGRARGLLPAGVLLALATVVVSGLPGPTAGPATPATGLFDHPVAYTSAAAFPVAGDRLDVGDLQVDLTGLALTSDAAYHAQVDTGRIVVQTPPGTGVVLHYAVDTGDVQAYDAHVASGSELVGDKVLVPTAAGQHTLTLDLMLDTGVVEVRS